MSLELQGKMRQYLLGHVTEAEREEVETTILTDDKAFEELEIVESELVDDYLAGKLSPAERTGFENSFCDNAERQQDIQFSRVLHRYVNAEAIASTRQPGPAATFWQRTWVRPAALGLAFVIIVLGTVWYVRSRREETTTFVAATLTLSAGNRGEGNNSTSVKLPSNVDAVKLNLQLPAPVAGSYKIRLVRPSGEEELKIAGVHDQLLTVIIPADQISRGAYAFKLYQIRSDGSEERISGSYLFSVE
ncbi:MAG TPA: hypothetical protein VF088_01630 [Pyrinomonadaceae bacterium]